MGRFFLSRLLFNYRFWRSKCLASALCCIVCAPLYAAQLTAEQLINNAYADGGLIATASSCRFPKDTINQLIYLQKKVALDNAQQLQLPFTAKDYDDYVVNGFQATIQSLQQYANQNDMMEGVCESVAEKIARKLQPDNLSQ